MPPEKLFHISENPDIRLFEPRPSPVAYEAINGDVVFAVNDAFLHNYFFPRDCPRIAYGRVAGMSDRDRMDFFNTSIADYILTVETSWYQKIKSTTLYCYEFSSETFALLDENAGYYVSDKAVTPLSVRKIDDLIGELLTRNVELRLTPNLWPLADLVEKSGLPFSMIRMRNAAARVA